MQDENRLKNIENQLSQLLERVGIQKQWLNTNEVAYYLGYSVESIHKMVKNGEFQQGFHYHKKIKRLLFNKTNIDIWVQSDKQLSVNSTNYNVDNVISGILSSLVA